MSEAKSGIGPAALTGCPRISRWRAHPGNSWLARSLLRLLRRVLLRLGFLHADQRLLLRTTGRATAFQRRNRIVDAHRDQQAFEHFHIARHTAVRRLADASGLVRGAVGRPALVELL